ncbi:MAG: hypothetical protein [Bacteriophage sp.]|nr:MAG: hypothetical protein [Bacteriophage sp.]
MSRSLVFEGYKVTVEKLPPEEQPKRTDLYDYSDFYYNYIMQTALNVSQYAKESGLVTIDGRSVTLLTAHLFYYRLDSKLRKKLLTRAGYPFEQLFRVQLYHMNELSWEFIDALERGLIMWKEVTALADSKRFKDSIMKECKALLVKGSDEKYHTGGVIEPVKNANPLAINGTEFIMKRVDK